MSPCLNQLQKKYSKKQLISKLEDSVNHSGESNTLCDLNLFIQAGNVDSTMADLYTDTRVTS